jgi:antitoxin (DNA-binding transcriptional repressor) of toxin-antitoxin stability system/mRNA-degrading endonuclease RelE of RelBE toxin-antitoxin system
VDDHLSRFTKRDQTMILDAVPRQLGHEPTVPTRNRKPLEANPLAPWELRIGEYRVYFDVKEEPERVVYRGRRAQRPRPRAHRRHRGKAAMKTIDVAEANTTLSEYARRGLREAVVVTRRGKPVLALTPVRGDWESLAVAHHPEFLAIVERSRASLDAGKGISTEQMRRRLGLGKRKAR